MPGLPPDIRAHTAANEGLLTRQELRDLGYSHQQVDRMLSRQLLTPVYRGVFLLAGAPMSPLGRHLAALKRAGAGARLAGPSTCAILGLEGFDLAAVTPCVVVDPSRRVRGVDFTVLHSEVPRPDRALLRGRLPATTAVRGLIDSAPLVPSKTLRVAYDSAVRCGTVDAVRFQGRVTELGQHPGARRCRTVLSAAVAGKESEGERSLAGIFRPGDPRPRWQVWVLPHRRVDAMFLEAWLALEYHSRTWHGLAEDHDRDNARALELQAADVEILRITAGMLRRPEHTRSQILAVYRRRLELGRDPFVPAR